jgi:hypothetical protein
MRYELTDHEWAAERRKIQLLGRRALTAISSPRRFGFCDGSGQSRTA